MLEERKGSLFSAAKKRKRGKSGRNLRPKGTVKKRTGGSGGVGGLDSFPRTDYSGNERSAKRRGEERGLGLNSSQAGAQITHEMKRMGFPAVKRTHCQRLEGGLAKARMTGTNKVESKKIPG